MTRINAIRTTADNPFRSLGHQAARSSATWGKKTSALIFAAVLIVCSVTVGCSSDTTNRNPSARTTRFPCRSPRARSSPCPRLSCRPTTKPAPKKVVHKKPATVNYADKTYGVTFEYPRRYAIETGNAATELLAAESDRHELRPARRSRTRRRRASRDQLRQHRLLVRILQRERPQEPHRRSMHRVRRAPAQAGTADGARARIAGDLNPDVRNRSCARRTPRPRRRRTPIHVRASCLDFGLGDRREIIARSPSTDSHRTPS